MKIFIGSSRERSNLVASIEVWIEQQGHEPVPWYQPGLFGIGEHTFKTLIQISRTVQAAVFVFSPDDQIWYRGESLKQPRDNVLIEYGLFAGALGPEKTAICRDGDPRHAVDLAGLAYIDLSEHSRARGKLELSIWAGRLASSSPVDPALLRQLAKTAELERELASLNMRLDFEVEKSKGLETIISRAEVFDFSRYDLGGDGHWKLLFKFTYFQDAADAIATSVDNPVQLRQLIVDGGANHIANDIAWLAPGSKKKPDMSADRKIFFARKVLRRFRDFSDPNLYLKFVRSVPADLSKQLESVAKSAIDAMADVPPA
jgi:hypothetical protein